MAKKIFKEEQRFKGWDVVGLLAFLILGLTFRFVGQFWQTEPGTEMSLLTYLALMLPMLGGLWYILSLKLSIRISNKSISLKYSPWHKKRRKIKWRDVEKCEIQKTSNAAQWCGWNVSFDNENNYSLSGRTGIHLKTKDGKDYFIGSKNPNELEEAIQRVFASS